jgi:hypothetical protein
MDNFTSGCAVEMSLADHAESWWRESGHTVPDRNSDTWSVMYEQWVRYAFGRMFHANQENEDE